MLPNNEDIQNAIYKILLLMIIIVAMSAITLVAWNMSLAQIFEIRQINFFEAIWLNVLSHILLRPIEISFDK